MTENRNIPIVKRGVITIPQSLRKKYNLKQGDVLTLIDLDGVFVLSPHRSVIDELAGDITRSLMKKGESLESMLKTLKDRRHRDGRRKVS